MHIENENNLKQALTQGANLFTGSGFSVLAKDWDDRPLPTGRELAHELTEIFKIPNAESLDLSKISTILEYDKKSDFYAYIKKRFKVKEFNPRYYILDKLNIKTIFTTNIDDLIHKVYTESKRHYINDLALRGPAFDKKNAIDFIALHGSILVGSRPLTFGSRDIAAAFSENRDNWYF